MAQPLQLLVATAAVIGLVCLVFWPRAGLVARLLRGTRLSEREAIEDALKHLYDCQYVGAPGSVQSLAGAVAISASQAARLVARLESLGLVRTEGASLHLTAEGRRYALRVIRIHRLWETYLADRTGYAEADWHFEADRREHTTSRTELQRLVQSTGNPRFDPHGDPIPTAAGDVPARRGQPLGDLAAGTAAMVVHIEDEPEAIYAQLRAQGLRPLQRLTVLDKSPERIRVEIDGEEQVMAPVVAGNVWVTPLPQDMKQEEPADRLSSLRTGQTRTVVGISPRCQGVGRRRLLDLGLVPGTAVTAVMTSPTADPTAYRIRGALIALRREQADLVQVERTTTGEAVR
jgi:DtxR family Mn-dependent transcriptional regulator